MLNYFLSLNYACITSFKSAIDRLMLVHLFSKLHLL
nr:MAG TPA: hypothetical protein [Caudoviricetes sp.]